MLREHVDQSESPRKEKLEKICARLERQVGHIANILERFQDFARPEELKLERTELDQVLSSVADTVRQKAESNGIEIRVSAPGGLEAEVDPARFSQALLNLALNAIDSMESGGILTMSGRLTGAGVVIEVSDTGPGIPKDLRNKVFDLFFSTKDKGTGLGLPIVQRTVHDHGGTIELAEREDGGAVFRITLPGVDDSRE
jgi:signal transduction histidine kinase